MTYEEAKAAVIALSARAYALKESAPKLSADPAEHIAYAAARAQINEEAKASGFRRSFDGSFFLDLKKYA